MIGAPSEPERTSEEERGHHRTTRAAPGVFILVLAGGLAFYAGFEVVECG